MSSILAQAVKKSEVKEGLRMIVAGAEGVGKTHLLCSAPKPILLAVEKGYSNVDLDKVTVVEINSYVDYLNVLSELSELVTSGKMPYESIITDSVSALERMINAYVMSLDPTAANSVTSTMISCHGGFAKAHGIATKEFQKVIEWIDWFRTNGVNSLMTCHVFADTIEDTDYGTKTPFLEMLVYSPKKANNYGARELLSQLCDIIGYLDVDTSSKEGRKITLNTVMNARNRAKNRFDIVEHLVIPKDNGWNVMADKIFENKNRLAKYDYRSN
jgi:hypothetical protein